MRNRITITLKPDNLILRAFDIHGDVEALAGGQSNSWKIGNYVLKYVGADHSNEWSAAALNNLTPVGYRISAPVRSQYFSFVFNGWTCSRFEVGTVLNGNELRKLEVSRLFHRSLKSISLNDYVRANNKWERGHRVAWSGKDFPSQINSDSKKYIDGLLKFTCPQEGTNVQIIHGDLAENILFDDRYPPLIIDFSPTIASVQYAESILMVDSIAWHNAPIHTLMLLPQNEYYKDMLLRAVIFRLVVAAQVSDQTAFTETRTRFQCILNEILSEGIHTTFQ